MTSPSRWSQSVVFSLQAALPDDSDDDNRNKKKGKGKKGANKAKEDDAEVAPNDKGDRKKPKGGKKGQVSDDEDENEVKEAPAQKEAQQGRRASKTISRMFHLCLIDSARRAFGCLRRRWQAIEEEEEQAEKRWKTDCQQR